MSAATSNTTPITTTNERLQQLPTYIDVGPSLAQRHRALREYANVAAGSLNELMSAIEELQPNPDSMDWDWCPVSVVYVPQRFGDEQQPIAVNVSGPGCFPAVGMNEQALAHVMRRDPRDGTWSGGNLGLEQQRQEQEPFMNVDQVMRQQARRQECMMQPAPQ